jgi:hypothetical protein
MLGDERRVRARDPRRPRAIQVTTSCVPSAVPAADHIYRDSEPNGPPPSRCSVAVPFGSESLPAHPTPSPISHPPIPLPLSFHFTHPTPLHPGPDSTDTSPAPPAALSNGHTPHTGHCLPPRPTYTRDPGRKRPKQRMALWRAPTRGAHSQAPAPAARAPVPARALPRAQYVLCILRKKLVTVLDILDNWSHI